MEDEIVPLLTCDDGSFELCKETLEWLSTLNEPFGIISCAGKFRTGKSFLLNRILDSKPNQGFGVGETVQACTKGLWISKKLIRASDNLNVIIMDTEGIDALDASSTHDTKIFTLGILLSSIFLYNSVGHIDETAVQTLSFMSKVSEFVDSDAIPPKFYWILRDFSLQMVDKDGKTLNNKEYLEYSLTECSGEKNDTRSCIKKLFEERDLFTLPRPSKTDSAQNLDKAHKNLNPKFMSEMARLREKLLDEVVPITANGIPMSGNMFVKMCNILVEKVKSSEMPVMKDAWSMLRDIQHNDVYRSLYSLLLKEVDEWKNDTFKNLEKKSVEVEEKYTNFFKEKAMKPTDSNVFNDFTNIVKELLEKKVKEKQINIKEIVEKSISNIDMNDCGTVLNEMEKFTIENGERNACIEWFPKFIEKMYVFNANAEKEYMETAKKEANEQFQFDFEELTRKYEDSMSNLEYEKSEVLKLRSEMLSQEEKIVVKTVSVGVNTETEENISNNETIDVEAFGSQVKESEEYKLLSKENDSLSREREFLSETLDSYKNQLSFLKEKVEEDIKEIKSEYSSKISNLNEIIKNKEIENESQCRKIALFEETIKHNVEEIKKLETKNYELHLKFMEFHKQTIEEIRKRDNETRQNQATLNQELISMNRKAQEEKRLASVSQTETLYLKRQLEDHDSIQQDLKRLKRDHNDIILVKTRNEVENSNLKTRLQEVMSECDSLRKNNMKLENKIAVLETTTMLSNCKKSIME